METEIQACDGVCGKLGLKGAIGKVFAPKYKGDKEMRYKNTK